MRRVVVTGMGAVTPLGVGVAALFEGVLARRSAVTRIDDLLGLDIPVLGAPVRTLPIERLLPPHEVRHHDRFVQLALLAADEALRQADLPADGREAVGVYFATALGGVRSLTAEAQAQAAGARVGPRLLPKVIPNMAGGAIAERWGFRGPNLTFTTACAASAHAIGEAFLAIAHGRLETAVAGGAESLFAPVVIASLDAARALSRRFDDPGSACRPFSDGRDGMVMGEGAAALVLESLEHAQARGARVLGRILGYGASDDAHHPTHPHPEGHGAYLSMARALAQAGLEPDDIDYLNAHGTSTLAGDEAELRAVARLFPTPPPMSSIKGATGHLMGAAGAAEAVVTLEAMRRGILPPTVNYLGGAPASFDLIPTPRPARIRRALSNSFGFGGQNATLVLGSPDEEVDG